MSEAFRVSNKTFSKKVIIKVVAISVASNEERGRVGVNDSRVPVYIAGMEVVHDNGKDIKFFPFLPSHITATLIEHPTIGERFSLTFEKVRTEE